MATPLAVCRCVSSQGENGVRLGTTTYVLIISGYHKAIELGVYILMVGI